MPRTGQHLVVSNIWFLRHKFTTYNIWNMHVLCTTFCGFLRSKIFIRPDSVYFKRDSKTHKRDEIDRLRHHSVTLPQSLVLPLWWVRGEQQKPHGPIFHNITATPTITTSLYLGSNLHTKQDLGNCLQNIDGIWLVFLHFRITLRLAVWFLNNIPSSRLS